MQRRGWWRRLACRPPSTPRSQRSPQVSRDPQQQGGLRGSGCGIRRHWAAGHVTSFGKHPHIRRGRGAAAGLAAPAGRCAPEPGLQLLDLQHSLRGLW